MDKPDMATIIDSHFEEMIDLEQEIASLFLQAETITDDLSSQQVTQKLHIFKLLLTRFAKSVALLATENLFSNTNIRQKIKPTKSPQAQTTDQTSPQEVIAIMREQHKTWD